MYTTIYVITLLLALAQLPLISAAKTSAYQSNAVTGVRALQGMYDQQNGLWKTTGWWQSANCLITLADLTKFYPDISIITGAVWENTWQQAQKYNTNRPKMKARRSVDAFAGGKYQSVSVVAVDGEGMQPKGFINNYFDDEGWWAQAWIRVYDVTRNPKYLQTAADIFNDMVSNGANASCGGIWWTKEKKQSTAIANELFLAVAAQLANRVQGNKDYYTNWAKKQWDWFQKSGLINDGGTINDSLDMKTCKNAQSTVWSYNQGVILGGLIELNYAAPDPKLIPAAHRIAKAAINLMSDKDGILHDPTEPDMGEDGPQFKGIFMRNLRILQKATGEQKYKKYLERNAQSIWDKARDSKTNLIGTKWSGPVSKATASSQSSALDALIAAAAVQ